MWTRRRAPGGIRSTSHRRFSTAARDSSSCAGNRWAVGRCSIPLPRSSRLRSVLVGAAAIVGLSTHTVEQIDRAVTEPVSYVAIGPVFATATKATGYDRVGLEMVRAAAVRAAEHGLPLVAIGGITLDTAASVIAAGAASVAVIGGLLAGGDPERRTRDFLQALNGR
jgi:thiamine monophosphate synthase